uniref:Cationic amino acid transporter C-terminal domain-containing protein n=1 Tax=Caenorhabditis japonica TaxID=281687 RepID=A0A8R1I0L8_CAEJA
MRKYQKKKKIVLVYFQHYHPEQIGIPEETSSYKAIGKKRTRVHIDDGVSIDNSSTSSENESQKKHRKRREEDEDEDESMVSHSTFDTTAFLYMKATKMETERLQRRLDREQLEREKDEERRPVLLAKSVSQYHSIDENCKKISKKHAHNCVAERCAVDNEDDDDSQEVHLFANEEPELPFFSTFSPSVPRPPSPDVNFSTFHRSQRLLACFFVTTSLFATYLRMFAEPTATCWLLSSGLFAAVVAFTVSINRLQTNDYLYKKESKVTLFPTVSLFSLFLLALSFVGSVPIKTLAHLAVILLIGLISYFAWGYGHSKHRKTACLVIENRYSDEIDADQYCPIVGLDTTSAGSDIY